MPTKELFKRLTLEEIYQTRVVSKTQPGEWEYPAPLIGEFATTLPTPLQSENDVLGTTAGAITMLKQWDLSPVDQSSFDPTEPPGRPIGPPVNTVPPVITGTPQVGQTLTVAVGTWSGSPTFTGQWFRGATPIAGAVGPTYNLVALDSGAIISAEITGTNANGSSTATSNSVGPVLPAAPTNIIAPAVTGVTITGNILSCSNGTWTGSPTYALQWLRGAGNRPGSTTNTITLSAADEGNLMSCRVTATNAGGSLPVTSGQVGPITPTAADPGDEPAPQPTRPQRPRR